MYTDMSETLTTVDDVIEMFGGPTKCAKWANVTDNAVIWWRKRGLPPSVHLRLLAEANRRNVKVCRTLFKLDEEDWAALQGQVPSLGC